MKKAIWVSALLIIGILVIAAAWTTRRDAESIRIGAALGLSGYCASWGEGELHAIQLAVAEANEKGGINGKQIELVVEDMACDAKATVNAAIKLVDADHVAAVIGPTWGDAFQGVFSVMNERRVAIVSPSMAMESLVHDGTVSDYVFSTWFPQQGEVDALETYIAASGNKNIVILHDEDTFGSTMAALFEERAPAHGLSISKSYKFPLGFSDFRTSIVELKSIHSDGIFAVFANPATKAKFFKQAKDLGLDVKFFNLTDIEDATLVENFGSALEGVIYTHGRTTKNGEVFQEKYAATYNGVPVGLSGLNAYDATNVLIEALRKTDGKRAGVREALLDVSIPGTVAEEVSFNEKHQIRNIEFVIKTIKDGKFVEIE